MPPKQDKKEPKEKEPTVNIKELAEPRANAHAALDSVEKLVLRMQGGGCVRNLYHGNQELWFILLDFDENNNNAVM
jgi:hypothetical protein